MKDICPKDQCTGCTACVNACAKAAITMVPDQLGFMYPVINESLCVNCGLCEFSCPNNNPVIKNSPQEAYVGHAVDSEEQLTSTSGGIASVISRWCLRQGGVVYGCSAKECTHVKHIRVTCEEDLKYLKGSKYVQSDLNICYTQVREDLRDNRMVVFIGTPCQCAGLRCYLKKEYDNLYLIDFVCHGVPSQMILNEDLKQHVTEHQQNNAHLSFRRKMKSGNNYKTQYGIFIKDSSGIQIYGKAFPKNTYITGFLTALFYRNSCYQCHYTTPERVSDLTIGDYGDHNKEFEMLKGRCRILSMASINTVKGKHLFTIISDDVNYAPIEYAKLVSCQGQLQHPMKRHKYRERLEAIDNNESVIELADNMLKDDRYRIKKNLIISKFRDTVFSIPYFKFVYNQMRNR